MSKMKKFHKLLSGSSESHEPYLQALRTFTKIGPARLVGHDQWFGLVCMVKIAEAS